jgi:hypothetical protein
VCIARIVYASHTEVHASRTEAHALRVGLQELRRLAAARPAVASRGRPLFGGGGGDRGPGRRSLIGLTGCPQARLSTRKIKRRRRCKTLHDSRRSHFGATYLSNRPVHMLMTLDWCCPGAGEAFGRVGGERLRHLAGAGRGYSAGLGGGGRCDCGGGHGSGTRRGGRRSLAGSAGVGLGPGWTGGRDAYYFG